MTSPRELNLRLPAQLVIACGFLFWGPNLPALTVDPKPASERSVQEYFESIGQPLTDLHRGDAAAAKMQAKIHHKAASDRSFASSPKVTSSGDPLGDKTSPTEIRPATEPSLVSRIWDKLYTAAFAVMNKPAEEKSVAVVTSKPDSAEPEYLAAPHRQTDSKAAGAAGSNRNGGQIIADNTAPKKDILQIKEELGDKASPSRRGYANFAADQAAIDKILGDGPQAAPKRATFNQDSQTPGDPTKDDQSGQTPRTSRDKPQTRAPGVLSGAVSDIPVPSGTQGPEGAGRGQTQGQIPIRVSSSGKRGININSEVPSVRHVTMSAASKRFGGDDVEIAISPLYDVLIQMPEAVEYFRSSNSLLQVTSIQSNPNLVTLKLSPTDTVVPISLHLVDVSENIYTFTVVGQPADLAWEYPKTIIVNKRIATKTILGSSNPKSVIDAMDVDDAIQLVVGDVPRTGEYEVEMVSGKYQHYEGYAQYAFRIFKKDKSDIDTEKLKFTIWANEKRLDGGSLYSSSRNVEWVVEPMLSARETRRRGQKVLRVFVQIRASILDLEEWESAFITVGDGLGYSRFDFQPIIRPFRAPNGREGRE